MSRAKYMVLLAALILGPAMACASEEGSIPLKGLPVREKLDSRMDVNFQGMSLSEVMEFFRRRLEIDDRVSRLVGLGVEAGEFEVADPAIAASAITMMISYCFQWSRKDPRPTRDEFVDIVADIAMRTLLPAGARPGPVGDAPTAGRRR